MGAWIGLLVALAGVIVWVLVQAAQRACRARVVLDLPEDAAVVAADLGERCQQAGITRLVLRDLEWGLVGSPDQILQERDGPVPVEYKRVASGQPPSRLYPSQMMQVGAYFRLCMADPRVGKRPPYGLVQFIDGEGRFLLHGGKFQVENTEALRDMVGRQLLEMRGAMCAGEVHRNHNVHAKCRRCSVREACGEVLS